MPLKVISWNIFHGRDAPPDRALYTWRSRLTRRTERGSTHLQVNRELLPEFATLLGEPNPDWDIAILQECPPRWADELSRRLDADLHLSLTSRNTWPRLRAAIARRNPDLIASGEGGSNLTLVRHRAGRIVTRRELAIRRGPRPERRTMALTTLENGLSIANLPATNDQPDLAAEELRLAASTALRWAGDDPLIFAGDFNLRPAEQPEFFVELEREFGLSEPTSGSAIDHILVRGLKVIKPPQAVPAEARELSEDGLSLRLSDHAPVCATFELD